jgi:CMP-N-acetylneuraminic acid synthetase
LNIAFDYFSTSMSLSRKQARSLWAIVAARSGSKGFPDKNIALLNGVPLLAHSIAFARKLSFVSRIVLSTDSEEYARVGREFGANVPFLRRAAAASDVAMEEDVLEDILTQCTEARIELPTSILWLRPTHPLRSTDSYEAAYKLFSSALHTAVCVVTQEDPRIFHATGDALSPPPGWPPQRSMARRQELAVGYRIFGGELFPMPMKRDPLFLGTRIGFVVAPSECRFDIDSPDDLATLNELLVTASGRTRFARFVHGAR